MAFVGMGVDNSTTDHANRDMLGHASGRNRPWPSTVHLRGMRAAASSPAWKGAWARIYITSAVWNVRQGNWSACLGRSATALASTVTAGSALLHADFYRALRSRYESVTFARGFTEA